MPDETFQMILADPPYFQVLTNEKWDNQWQSEQAYLEWTLAWISECQRLIKPDGLVYIFGQLGKREHVWLHVSSAASKIMQFHDMLIWDRVVGYNERRDSFTPCYEMILVLRKSKDCTPHFNKDAIRIPYDSKRINAYLRDKRYKDKQARLDHLKKGKYSTNILRVPSLKGSSGEKIGHSSQKPLKLIRDLVTASTRQNDWILDPFIGSGTTAVAAEELGRRWVGIEADPASVVMTTERVEKLRKKSLPTNPDLKTCGEPTETGLELLFQK